MIQQCLAEISANNMGIAAASEKVSTAPPEPLDAAQRSPERPGASVGRSAWESAVDLAQLRDRRRAFGQDCSVRTLAGEAGCSRGRAGELLKMHDMLSGDVALYVGWGDSAEGERLLARLSYRELRSAMALPAPSAIRRALSIQRMAAGRIR